MIIKNCNLIDMVDIYEARRDIRIQDGKIVEISERIDLQAWKDARVIDAGGDFVTPGIVEPHSSIGLREEIYRFEGDDSDEKTDPILPQLRALDGINPTDEGIIQARAAGVTTVVSGPGNSNLIGGVFAAFKTYGKTTQDMIIDEEIAFKMSLGNEPKKAYGDKGKMPQTRMASAAMIREALIKAKEYHGQYHRYKEDGSGEIRAPKFDIKLNSLMRVFDGMLVKFTAHQAYDIVTAIRIGEEFELNYTVDKASEAYLIADELKGFDVRFVVGPAYGGKRDHEIRNRDTIIASIMEAEGLDFALSTGHPEMNISMAMIQAAMMHKKGLSRERALKAMTIHAARMVGLDARIGSIEEGKDADLVIWDGEPLDYYTSARMVLINGELVHEKK